MRLEHELVRGVSDLNCLVHVELGPDEADELDVPIIVHAEQLRGVEGEGEGGVRGFV